MDSESSLAQWITIGTVTVLLVCSLFVLKKGQYMGNILGNRTREEISSKLPNPPSDCIKQLNDYVWQLYVPHEGQSIELDIVFFHGLQPDHFEDAFWKSFVATDDEKLVWPREWLSLLFPNARILSISYDYGAKQTDMYTLGENLVVDVILGGQSIGQNRPVFLVGHSLGGLLIKQLILSAKRMQGLQRPKPDIGRIKNFLQNFSGVFYYSTPHGGSNIESMARKLQSASPILGLLKVLDAQTQRINEDFRKHLETLKIPAMAVVEGSPTNYLGFSILVVEEDSARRDVNSHFKHVKADHFTVCKARSKGDDTVIRKLARFILDNVPDRGEITTTLPEGDEGIDVLK